jgi:hypothetical protein
MVVAAEIEVIQRPVGVQQWVGDHDGARLVPSLVKVNAIIAVARLVVSHAGRHAEREGAEQGKSQYLVQQSVHGLNVPQALRTCLNGP